MLRTICTGTVRTLAVFARPLSCGSRCLSTQTNRAPNRSTAPTVVPHVSFSSIKSFRDCPKSFYFSRVLKIPTTSNVNMVYGSALHAAIEALYAPPSDGESMSSTHRLDEALEAYDDVWATSEFCISSQIPYPEGVRGIRDSGEDEVRNFFDRYSSSESPATSDPTPIDRIMHLDATGWKRQPEKRFEVWIGDEGSTRVKLRGVWDMLCEPVEQEPAHSERDEDVDRAQRRLRKRTGQQKLVGKKSPSSTPPPTIIEFKSTLRADRQRPRNWHAPHMLQLQVYAVAHRAWLKERTGDASTVELRLALKSVESSEEHVASFSEEDLDKVESSLVETYLQMQNSGFHATPSYQACSFCSYQHICSEADFSAARYQGRAAHS